MKKRKETIAVGLLIFYVLFSGQVFATKLKILTEDLPPYQIVSEDAITGLSTEIVQATLAQTSYTYNIAAYPWSMAYNRAKHENNTCIYSIARIPQRESLFKWIGHIASRSISLYSHKDSQVSVTTLEEAKKYNIAVIRNDVSHHYLLSKGFIENKNLYVTDNDKALLKFLNLPNRNIDLIVFNDLLLKSRVKSKAQRLQYKNVFQFKNLMLNFYLACSLNTEKHITDNLTKAMTKLDNLDVFSKIREKWEKNVEDLSNK